MRSNASFDLSNMGDAVEYMPGFNRAESAPGGKGAPAAADGQARAGTAAEANPAGAFARKSVQQRDGEGVGVGGTTGPRGGPGPAGLVGRAPSASRMAAPPSK